MAALQVANGVTVGIGSLPHRDLDAGIRFALEATAIPTVPSLPKRSPAEGIIVQAMLGIEGVTVGQYGAISVDLNRIDPIADVSTDLQHDAFAGFRRFLELAAIRHADPELGPIEAVKWQLVGPVTLGTAAYSLARQPIDMVANAINTGAFPEMVSRFDRQGPAAAAQFLSQLMALMMRLCLPIAALLTALAHDITALVLPADYQGHVGALFPIIAVSVISGNLTSFVFENVIHAHKRNWLLIGLMAPGSVATIGLSLLLIPAYAEVGAALALAGGSMVTLLASVVVSHRLTPVPVPWGNIAVSALVAVATGAVAALASAILGDVWPVFKLAAGGFAGGVTFLGLNSLLHPAETRRFAGMVRSRLGIA